MIATVKPSLAGQDIGYALSGLLFSFVALIMTAQMASASARISAICDHAALVAASESGVPLSVLRSITRTETGRMRNGALQPWPWTVNMEGKGKWFDTEDAARAYVFKHFKRGARSFDVGCFQINYKWHGAAFRSIEEMFDPLTNARYAAQFLSRLYAETKDWSQAAGTYHSRTAVYARNYRIRFDRIYRKMKGAPQPDPVTLAHATPGIIAKSQRIPGVNTYPLLQTNAVAGQRGSLVPLGQSSAPALIRNSDDAQGS